METFVDQCLVMQVLRDGSDHLGPISLQHLESMIKKSS